MQFLCAKAQKEIEVTTVTPNRLRGILANLNLNQILFELEMSGVVRPLAGGTYHLIS